MVYFWVHMKQNYHKQTQTKKKNKRESLSLALAAAVRQLSTHTVRFEKILSILSQEPCSELPHAMFLPPFPHDCDETYVIY